MKRMVIFSLAAVVALVLAACSQEGFDGNAKSNQPPNVWLSAGPPEGSTSQYRIKLFCDFRIGYGYCR